MWVDLQQEELSLNADFSRQLTDAAHLAFGAEWREETFTIVPGEPAAYFGFGSSGFKGFEPGNAGDFPRDNLVLYAEIEQESVGLISCFNMPRVSKTFPISATPSTARSPLATMPVPNFSLRGAVSTGFHAPTPGQANIQKITTHVRQRPGIAGGIRHCTA